MYTRRNIRTGLILRFAWKNLLFFTIWATLVTVSYVYLQPHHIDIRLPFLPLSTIGIAVSFYMGFKNSQSYDRFWEGRKQWGGILNLCRQWGGQVRGYVINRHMTMPLPNAELHVRHRDLIYRQLAWANALRLQLRRSTIYDRQNLTHTPTITGIVQPAGEPRVEDFLSAEEYAQVMSKANPAAQILHNQSQALTDMLQEGLIEDFRHIDMMMALRDAYTLQGACERIKNTPFPRQYAYFSNVFVRIFVLLLPFGLLGEFSKMADGTGVWLNIPFSVLISWIFTTMEIVGDNSEDPFENYVNDVPMTAICRTVEIDLREMLGETQLPARMQPVDDILL
ncbi:bestrophin family protein [Hymenobacter rubidus]|uniref:bestrophin family protein n=1 Tax=Hymenobacter rubidus TaxID=1441626 RepID=UPI00191D0352|nr:bestrophin family ion channel [Hymenobacter rubidus]